MKWGKGLPKEQEVVYRAALRLKKGISIVFHQKLSYLSMSPFVTKFWNFAKILRLIFDKRFDWENKGNNIRKADRGWAQIN